MSANEQPKITPATIENIGELQEVDPTVENEPAKPTVGLVSAISNVGSQIQGLITNAIAPASAPEPAPAEEGTATNVLTPDYPTSPAYAPSPPYGLSPDYAENGENAPLRIARNSYSEWSNTSYNAPPTPLDKFISLNSDSEASFYVEHEEEMIDYYEAIDSYYNYKDHYENSKTAIKNSINANHSDVSWRQKRNLYRKTKPACINCKRKVGTVFATEYVEDKADPNNIDKTARILKARCGDDSAPCSLDIQIMIPYTIMFEKIFENNKKLIKTMQKMIIEEKNNAIFGYTERNSAILKFQTINNQLSTVIKDDEYVSLLFEYIANNSKKTKLLEETRAAFYTNINILRDYITEYEKTNDEQYIVDAVTLYNDEIVQQIEEIASLKYMYQTVEMDSNATFHLVQQAVNLPNMVYSSLDTARIVKYVVDNENIVPKKKSGPKPSSLGASASTNNSSASANTSLIASANDEESVRSNVSNQ